MRTAPGTSSPAGRQRTRAASGATSLASCSKSSAVTARPRERSSSGPRVFARSEEHTSELQSHVNLVCRLLLEKKNVIICLDIYNESNLPPAPTQWTIKYHKIG